MEDELLIAAYAAKQPRGSVLWDTVATKLICEAEQYLGFWAEADPRPTKPKLGPWQKLEAWLETEDATWLIEAAEDGSLPLYEAEAVLENFDIPASKANLRLLGQVITNFIAN